ncbi:MAG TPA: hypothetical protein VGK77_20510, partial [Candidatus Binatia bacterium]
MLAIRLLLIGILALSASCAPVAESLITDDSPLQLPAPGAHQLRILAPAMLELTLITTKKSISARVDQWDFVDDQARARLPVPGEFIVSTEGQPIAVKAIGFKRRVLYAPLKRRDLRIGNYLYLQLQKPVAENQTVEVENPSRKLWPKETSFTGKAEPLRWSPAIHVNQTGYLPQYPKKAMVGFYLGSLGELNLSEGQGSPNEAQLGFKLIEA